MATAMQSADAPATQQASSLQATASNLSTQAQEPTTTADRHREISTQLKDVANALASINRPPVQQATGSDGQASWQLPPAVLQLVLHKVGPHTRLVCQHFRDSYGPPSESLHLRQQGVSATSPPVSAESLQHVFWLADVQRVVCSPDLPLEDCTEAVELVASRARCLQELHLCEDFSIAEGDWCCALTAGLAQALSNHGSSLRVLSGFAYRGENYSAEEHSSAEEYTEVESVIAALLQLTALQDLRILQWSGRCPFNAISQLTQLTRLSYHGTTQCRHPGMLRLLEAAAQLPHLRQLDLPADVAAWSAEAVSAVTLLTQLTQLQQLQIGTRWSPAPGASDAPQPDISHSRGLPSSIRQLTNLTCLDLVNSYKWLTIDNVGALAALSRLRNLGLHIIVAEADFGVGGMKGDCYGVQQLQALGTRLWPLTSLRLTLDEAACSQLEMDEPEDRMWLNCKLRIAPLLCLVGASLRQLVLQYLPLPPDTLFRLGCFPQLVDLQIRQCSLEINTIIDSFFVVPVPATSAGMGALTALTSLAFDVEEQDLSEDEEEPTECARAAASELAQLTRLQQLSLAKWELSAAELWNLVPLRQLQHLTVAGFRWGDSSAACAVLQHCPALETVKLVGSKSRLTALDLRELAAA